MEYVYFLLPADAPNEIVLGRVYTDLDSFLQASADQILAVVPTRNAARLLACFANESTARPTGLFDNSPQVREAHVRMFLRRPLFVSDRKRNKLYLDDDVLDEIDGVSLSALSRPHHRYSMDVDTAALLAEKNAAFLARLDAIGGLRHGLGGRTFTHNVERKDKCLVM